MSKTTATIKIVPPAEILDAAIKEAIRPHAAALSAAMTRDEELEAKADAVHPDRMKSAALELLVRGEQGDDAALAELEAAGGIEGYIRLKSGMYHIFDGTRKAHARSSAALIAALNEDLIPALEKAGEKIEAQLKAVLKELGELPPDLSQHGAQIRGRCDGLRLAASQAHVGVGVAWSLTQLGLRHHIEAAAK